MHSPRFQLRESDLKSIFSASNIKRVWKYKIRNSMRNDIITDPLDYLDYRLEIEEICETLQQAICLGSYVPGSSVRIRMEKSKGLCRLIVIPSIEDALVLPTLSDALYADIKGKAPSDRSYFEPQDHSFSKNNALFAAPRYGSFRAWLDFQRNLFGFLQNRNFIVITDIANYYDSISYIHLRNIMSGLLKIRDFVLDMLIYVLSGMLWQPDYMPRIEIGLPQININAPRILAHCFLYELDDYLKSQFRGDFVRYMDDIDIGADNIAEAKKVLRDIDMILQTRQVRLNSGKTLILSAKDAATHFRVRENRLLDAVQKRLDVKMKNHRDIKREGRIISEAFRILYKKKFFDSGNGEKILKRMISIASRINASLDARTLIDVIEKRPNLREVAMRHVTRSGLTMRFLICFRRFVEREIFIDDVSLVEGAKAIVEAPSRNGSRILRELRLLIDVLKKGDRFAIYSALWLASKYLTATELLELLYVSSSVWKSDVLLGRVAGGLWPRFLRSGEEHRYHGLIETIGTRAR